MDDLLPVDPFAHRAPSGWWAQQEQQQHAKREDDDVEDLEDDDDDDDDDGDDDPDAEKSEEELRAELKAVRESLSKASGSGKKKRDRIKVLESELASARKPKPPADGDKSAEPDVETIRATVEAELKVKADTKIKRAEARGALRSAGVPPEQVGDLVAMLKLDDLDVDDEGEVEGLDEAIDELKAKWPQLFGAPRKRRSVSGGDDREGDGEKTKKVLSPSELQARVALGRASR